MKKRLMFLLGITMLLTACIGVTYDFLPPTVTLIDTTNTLNETMLIEANIDWHSNTSYNKTTDDVTALANEQKAFHVHAGQLIDYVLEDGFFDKDSVTIQVMQNDEVTTLAEDGVEAFRVPETTGEYMLTFHVDTTKGDAQYVRKLVVQ